MAMTKNDSQTLDASRDARLPREPAPMPAVVGDMRARTWPEQATRAMTLSDIERKNAQVEEDRRQEDRRAADKFGKPQRVAVVASDVEGHHHVPLGGYYETGLEDETAKIALQDVHRTLLSPIYGVARGHVDLKLHEALEFSKGIVAAGGDVFKDIEPFALALAINTYGRSLIASTIKSEQEKQPPG